MSVTNPFTIPFNQPTNFEVSQIGQSGSGATVSNISIPSLVFQTADTLLPNTTTFIARVNNPAVSSNPLNTAGIPGVNFIGTDSSTPVFWQGEDIVFDAFLYINGQTIDTNRYILHAILKASPYMITNSWAGIQNNGIYVDDKISNHFVIFIPSSITVNLLAGSFELDVWVVEKVNSLNDIKPRTILIGRTFLNVEYAAFSPNPESIETGAPALRVNLPNSYPPGFNTVQPGGEVVDDVDPPIAFT